MPMSKPEFEARGRFVFQKLPPKDCVTSLGYRVLEVNENLEYADKVAYEIAWCMNKHIGNFI